jgi:hypothetical protein
MPAPHPEVMKLAEAIARMLAREDHERETEAVGKR